MKYIIHILIVILLTVLTQVGGIIWIISLIVAIKLNYKKRYLFVGLYLLFNLLIIPPIANYFGRVELSYFNENLKPKNIIYPLLFRNYVTPELKELLENSAQNINNEYNFQITYLDANFPFYNGFPLLPHLSHNDGKKVDISFMYKTKDGKSTNKKPSLSGYGAFVSSENPTYSDCLGKGYWQYDYTKYFTFGIFNDLDFDEKRTKIIVEELLNQPKLQKLFIEPYLKTQLRLNNSDKIRFHGCRAVRHDDHIHLQIK
ncbi:hypothetical protein EGM88_02845 [Aureibaculum marinum]|uniref:Uncharacterized protein n=1 Tax=Aureibaculum marinum TaxID=2487930 RepID=A0A3N4NZG3_9FLAO|nr:hypothetical protein [Aureibaculum marinum]RPE00218.1 hypothetical protein EGM88_02845 [Aureibaculum marinum]